MKDDKYYAGIKPIPKEKKSIEFDEEFEMWAIVGEESGFYHAMLIDKEEIEKIFKEQYHNDGN